MVPRLTHCHFRSRKGNVMDNSIQTSHHNDQKRPHTLLHGVHYKEMLLAIMIFSVAWINQNLALQKMDERIARLEQMSQTRTKNQYEAVYPIERIPKKSIFTGQNSREFH